MAQWLSKLAALAALACLAACADPAIPFDRGATPRIATIGVLKPGWPENPTVLLASSPGQSFGLVGALITAAVQANREAKFREMLATRQFAAEPAFRSRLAAALRAKGYVVTEVAAEATRTKFVEAYPNTGEGIDAWLDCMAYTWGYMAAGVGDNTPYRPYMGIRCRLTRAGGQAVLMRDWLVYNPYIQSDRFIAIAPDPRFGFVSSDDMLAEPDRAVQGLEAAFDGVADAIGTLLK